MDENKTLPKDTRFEVRIGRNGWCTVTIKEGFESTTPVIETYKIRGSKDVLTKVTAKAKEMGAPGVGWGAVSATYWVGLSY